MEQINTPPELIQLIKDRKILFIASKKKDYLRIVQELRMLSETGLNCEAICFNDRSYVRRMIKLVWRLLFLRTSDYDVIFVSFLPQMVIPFFFWKWRRKTVVTDFFISVYDTLVNDRKKFRDGTMFSKILWHIDRRTLELSDYVVADTKADAAYFSKEFHVPKERMIVWYLQADTAFYTQVEKGSSKSGKKYYSVLYFGSILPLQGVDIVLKAVNLLADKKQIRFVIIGPTSHMQRPSGDTVTYYDWLNQEKLAEKIAEADICLAGHFAGDIDKAKRTIPGKAYIYRAMGKPVILGDSPANHELFCEDHEHFFVEMGNAEALAALIEHKYIEWEQTDHD